MNKIKIHADTCLFLDRDGVINERLMGDYVKTPKEFKLLEGVKEFMSQIEGKFQHVFVVTNQQGIGKGLMTERDLNEVHQYFFSLLEVNPIDQVYFAPQLAHENHPDRKPGIGMYHQAQQDFGPLNAQHSILVGDSVSDLEFGKNAGMLTVYIHPTDKSHPKADFVIPSLLELLNIIEF